MNEAFGRISEKTMSSVNSLDELIEIMGTTDTGRKLHNVGSPESFKIRLEYFERFIKQELPEFSTLEILKFDRLFHKFSALYEYADHSEFLIAIEYKARKNE